MVAHVGNSGEYPGCRDVYLESAELPHWETELFDLNMPCVRVVDMIRWAERIPMDVVYDPSGNMEDWFLTGRRDDVQSLFT